MSEEEFHHRFVKAVVTKCFQSGKLPFGRNPGEYAEEVAARYWQEYLVGGGTPENFADKDALFWGVANPAPDIVSAYVRGFCPGKTAQYCVAGVSRYRSSHSVARCAAARCF